MMVGILPEAELEEFFEIIDDGDADITNDDDDDYDDDNNNLEDLSDNESCDRFVGVSDPNLQNDDFTALMWSAMKVSLLFAAGSDPNPQDERALLLPSHLRCLNY